MVFDEKPIMYPSLTEMITADGRTFREILEEKVSALVEILNKPIGTFQKHDNWKAERNKEAKAIVSELEDALFGPKNGQRVTHQERQKYLQRLFEETKKELEKEKLLQALRISRSFLKKTMNGNSISQK